jgi:transposase
VASVSHLAPIHLGLDVHRDSISVAILEPDQQVPEVDRIPHDEPSVRRLVGRLGDRRRLRACYEAGPTGFELARLLHSMDVSCQVIAPSLIPRAPGDKVKTDTRDCRRLARLHRAGELVAISLGFSRGWWGGRLLSGQGPSQQGECGLLKVTFPG